MNKIKIFISLLVFFVLLGGIVLFNYTVDAEGLFKENIQRVLAKEILEGNNIIGLIKFRQRLFQKEYIMLNNNKVDTIVLGSSRSMLFRKSLLSENNSFFNHSVDGAHLADIIAIIGIYLKEKQYIPKHVIIGVDPWIFGINITIDNTFDIIDYYNFILSKIKSVKSIQDSYISDETKLSNFIKKLLFMTSAKYLNVNFRDYFTYESTSKYFTSKSLDYNNYILATDGSRYYPSKESNLSFEKVKIKAMRHKDRIRGLKKIRNKDVFENFIKFLLSKNVKVTLLLNPYNPISYQNMIKDDDQKLIVDIENYIKSLKSLFQIEIIGSYNPLQYNLDIIDFTDGYHGKDRAIEEVVKKDMYKM